MASYAFVFTRNPGAIGTLKPHILLAVRAPGAIGSSTSKPHMLAARAVLKPHILLAEHAGNPRAIGSSTPKPHILLAARAGNPRAIGRSTPKPHILLAARAGNPRAIGSITGPHKFKFDEEDISSEENLWNLYERWRIHHNVFRGPDEIHKHFNIFKQKAMLVHNTNKLNLSYTLGLYIFSDMTEDEFRRYTGRGYKPKP